MNPEALPYPGGKYMTIAGCMALMALLTAVIYASQANPYTMVLFLGGGSVLLLAAVVLFGWTVWKDLRSRRDSIVMKELAPGQVIYRQGDPAEHVYVITRGQVEAVYVDAAKGDTIIGRLGPDEYFGESA